LELPHPASSAIINAHPESPGPRIDDIGLSRFVHNVGERENATYVGLVQH
jgi:hypothetical protein